MKRPLFAVIVILGILFSLSGPNHLVQASVPTPVSSLDNDQDGFSNSMEINGWYNQSGGPYHTNPTLADTDLDGLPDSQEKLFNTNPVDPQTPGITVTYDNSFKTFEYYRASDPAYLKMVQGGDKYLLTEAAVIRRGTTFKINAVNSLTAVLTITGDKVPPITPVRDPAFGGWNVTIPLSTAVGAYTAMITDGAWSKSMPIYVIFELPTDLTQGQVSTYLYDDNPVNKRDEVAVWFRAIDWKYYNSDSETQTPCNPTDPICSNWQYHTVSGYAQAFWTEQFTKNVLVNFSIPAIQGSSSAFDAAAAIGEKADQSVRINFASVQNNFSSATHIFYDAVNHPLAPYSQTGGGCETSAGVLTAILRSAGIAARPFVMDYNKTPGHGDSGNYSQYEYDTAVMMWVHSSPASHNIWYAERSFNTAEDEYQAGPNPTWTSGTTGLRILADVGTYFPASSRFKHFQDEFSDAVQSANEGWDFQNGSIGGGMVNTAWDGNVNDVPAAEFFPNNYINRDFKWNSKYPLQIQQSPFLEFLNCQLWKADGWAPSEWYGLTDPRYLSNPAGRTAAQTYYLPAGVPTTVGDIENWPYNPKPTSCSDSTLPDACTAFQNSWQPICAALPGQTLGAAQGPASQTTLPTNASLNKSIQLGNIISDAGLDQIGSGRFTQLVVNFELTSSVEGEYQVGGWLLAGDKQIRADHSNVKLNVGSQILKTTFDGQLLGDNKVNGPYEVEAIWIAPASEPISDQALPEEMAAYKTYSYTSLPYQASAFTVKAASIAGNYSYIGKNPDANGLFGSIAISVPLSIAIPGTFTVEGDLVDGQGEFVGHAQWTGSGPVASLEFTVANTVSPYSLEHLNLFDAQGKGLSSFYAPVYTIEDLNGKVAQGNIDQVVGPAAVSAQSIVPTNTFAASVIDTNGNGLYDQLVVTTKLNVTGTGGDYWMEGLLFDQKNMSAAWSVSAPQTLSVGQNQPIKMSYDTRILYDHLLLKGSQKFTLIAVKIFSGTPGSATLEANIPVPGFTTDAYSRSQFEPSNPGHRIFQDDMESNASKWNVTSSSQWSLVNNLNTSHSGNSSWIANGSATRNGSLQLAGSLDFTGYSKLWLQFNTAYQLSAGQSALLQVSTDGTLWTTLKTYTGSTSYWSTEYVDLSAYGKKTGVMIRFNAQKNPGLIWSIDDVYVISDPLSNIIFLPLVIKN
jgi:hypothetical protein